MRPAINNIHVILDYAPNIRIIVFKIIVPKSTAPKNRKWILGQYLNILGLYGLCFDYYEWLNEYVHKKKSIMLNLRVYVK